MRSDPLIQQVVGYWEALRAGRPAPLRAEVEPRGLEPARDRVFLAERIAPGTARLRRAGMALNEIMGMEVRGMPLSAFVAPPDRDAFAATIERVGAGPVRALLQLESLAGPGRPAIAAALALLPLVNDRDESPLLLGCLVCDGAIGLPPRRFSVLSCALIRYAVTAPATRVERPARRRPTATDPAAPETPKGLHEAPAPFTPSPPDLRLVKG
ncbi:PAS domain-containing protein [Acidimangrovimonas pyrenivorans]|uniref:PAS domain-containing protein n=1 Tax=Acidimangrovimonas pyrenivorans TaxID=2030798 RepID=A0ABV7AE45_9RHOB